jgi:type VI secretion system secreted protein Hcp
MATDAYLFLSAEVGGESQRAGHEGEIEVLAWSFGGMNPASVGIGSGGGVGSVTLQEFSLTKYTDSSSAALFQMMCSGQHFPTAKLTLYKAGGSAGALPYLTYEFEEVFVTGLSLGGSGAEDLPTENVSFAFGKVIMTYTQQDAAGTATGDYVGSWDIRRNTA